MLTAAFVSLCLFTVKANTMILGCPPLPEHLNFTRVAVFDCPRPRAPPDQIYCCDIYSVTRHCCDQREFYGIISMYDVLGTLNRMIVGISAVAVILGVLIICVSNISIKNFRRQKC